MYNKTTGPHFIDFGNAITTRAMVDVEKYNFIEKTIESKNITEVLYCSEHVIIDCIEGVGMLCLANSLDDILSEFIIHRLAQLNANSYFNIITMTDNCKIGIYIPKSAKVITTKLIEPFKVNHIQSNFSIDEIYSYYYNVKGPGYFFEGEKHNFFELIYVDNGTLTNYVDEKVIDVNEYELIILGPDQFHKQAVLNSKPCSYFSIMFSLSFENYYLLLNRSFKIARGSLEIINHIVNASDSKTYYSGDSMLSYLKLLIIELLEGDGEKEFTRPTSPINQKFENEMINEILTYIEKNIFDTLYLEDICQHFSISRSSLQNLFKDNLKIAPKQYINKVKLNKSQMLIKESKHTISEIASILGFNSIHYFSRKFTQHFKITPSDFAKSIYKDAKTKK